MAAGLGGVKEIAMRMYVRPQDQGQIIEVSYGYDAQGRAYRRTYDRSDRSEQWQRGEIDWDREPEHTDESHIPCVVEWIDCARP